MVKRENEGAETPGAVFGELLRIKRSDAGFTQDDLAELIHAERSLITKFESGKRVPRKEMVEKFDDFLSGRGELVRLHQRIKWTTRLSFFPDWFRRRAAMDARLIELHQYQTQLIPGLLQTEAYARALFERYSEGDEQAAEDNLEGRMGRQSRFLELDGPLYVVLLDESCLMHVIGSNEVMRESMDHLLAAGSLPNVHIQIVPFTLHHVHEPNTPMSLIVMPNGDRWVYSESLDMGHFSNDPKVLTKHQRDYDRLRADALSARDSAALIREARERYSTHD
ncbi:helix-turn-helix transcriptional regulator [Streptacidiphilus sp. P02-A3a]|uniref:helix-turn-helix domain-containing protein n=1 Tax=Streptacidiphilus sp. P02-A3a TaxID=2704468 RepID=UPI0015FE5639|nr:helix-turn-helix transcriptional regulator [Streptacidiphilus sp. P02-A3a]QMU68063.1 helix-turn-helix transcriptional regulator [Streptacidiphilus sp. P02-A3a]